VECHPVNWSSLATLLAKNLYFTNDGVLSEIARLRQPSLESVGGCDVSKYLVPVLAKWQVLAAHHFAEPCCRDESRLEAVLFSLLVLELLRKIRNFLFSRHLNDSFGIVIEAFAQEIQKLGLEFCSSSERLRNCDPLCLFVR